MMEVADRLALLHLTRPWWLALIPLAVFLWWRIRSALVVRAHAPEGLAPHLADALSVGTGHHRRLLPIDGVTAGIVLMVLAAAGPTWSRVPNPLVAQTAPLAVVLQVSQSMLSRDVAPSRLERAKFKIIDILATRAGARTALIAYAGTAHRVAPLSEDPEVLKPFLEGLSPDVMPDDGDNATAALELASSALAEETTPGAILFVVDGIDRADIPALQTHVDEGGAPIVILSIARDTNVLDDLAGIPGITRIALTADGSDVAAIERRVATAYRDALSEDERQMWEDQGWILAWPAALLCLLWFRRGWTMRWGISISALLILVPVSSARADGAVDWFLTADQQGRLAYEDRRYENAAELFQDATWRGHALYRAGKYAEAAEVFARIDTAEAAFAEGMAHIKSRSYRDGIAAFEAALERQPEFERAAHNLRVARAILAYVERAREQSDTGEESGIGADEVVYDNEAARGTETEFNEPEEVLPQTADQWMRTVDTQTSDFLRSRFALEAARVRP
jgi:Ca-activated chloride channel family protein